MKRERTRRARKMIIGVLLLVPLLAGGLFYFVVSFIVKSTTQLTTNRVSTPSRARRRWEAESFDAEAFFEKYPPKDIRLDSSRESHTIPVSVYFPTRQEKLQDVKTVLLVHGLWGSRYTVLHLAEMFLEKGYQTVVYDQRSSGENYAPYTTFGVFEQYDLLDVFNWVETFVKQAPIGLWGESFGGGTVALALTQPAIKQRASFAILDCPVSEMEWFVEDALIQDEKYRMFRSSLLKASDHLLNHRLGFHYRDAAIKEQLDQVTTPTLVIRTLADRRTPPFMGQALYEGISSPHKILWTVPDSSHVRVFHDYPTRYRQLVDDIATKGTNIYSTRIDSIRL